MLTEQSAPTFFYPPPETPIINLESESQEINQPEFFEPTAFEDHFMRIIDARIDRERDKRLQESMANPEEGFAWQELWETELEYQEAYDQALVAFHIRKQEQKIEITGRNVTELEPSAGMYDEMSFIQEGDELVGQADRELTAKYFPEIIAIWEQGLNLGPDQTITYEIHTQVNEAGECSIQKINFLIHPREANPEDELSEVYTTGYRLVDGRLQFKAENAKEWAEDASGSNDFTNRISRLLEHSEEDERLIYAHYMNGEYVLLETDFLFSLLGGQSHIDVVSRILSPEEVEALREEYLAAGVLDLEILDSGSGNSLAATVFGHREEIEFLEEIETAEILEDQEFDRPTEIPFSYTFREQTVRDSSAVRFFEQAVEQYDVQFEKLATNWEPAIIQPTNFPPTRPENKPFTPPASVPDSPKQPDPPMPDVLSMQPPNPESPTVHFASLSSEPKPRQPLESVNSHRQFLDKVSKNSNDYQSQLTVEQAVSDLNVESKMDLTMPRAEITKEVEVETMVGETEATIVAEQIQATEKAEIVDEEQMQAELQHAPAQSHQQEEVAVRQRVIQQEEERTVGQIFVRKEEAEMVRSAPARTATPATTQAQSATATVGVNQTVSSTPTRQYRRTERQTTTTQMMQAETNTRATTTVLTGIQITGLNTVSPKLGLLAVEKAKEVAKGTARPIHFDIVHNQGGVFLNSPKETYRLEVPNMFAQKV